MEKKLYITFPTTSNAIAMEKYFKDLKEFEFKLIPIPRFLSAGCGLAMVLKVEDEALVRKSLVNKEDHYEEIVIH